MKVLITGVTGQDGYFLAREYLRSDASVVGTTRGGAAAEARSIKELGSHPNFNLMVLDLRDQAKVNRLLASFQPNVICHLAADSSVSESFSMPEKVIVSTVQSTISLLNGMIEHCPDAKLMNAASSECFGGAMEPITELTCFNPKSPYAISKCASSYLVRSYRATHNIRAQNLFYFNHESHLRGENFVTKKLVRHAHECATGGRVLLPYGDLSVVRDWGLAREYMELTKLIGLSHFDEDYVVATGKSVSLMELAKAVFAYFGEDFQSCVSQQSVIKRPVEINQTIADPSKVLNDFNWTPTSDLSAIARELCEGFLGDLKSKS